VVTPPLPPTTDRAQPAPTEQIDRVLRRSSVSMADSERERGP
jgi:hypothetical protein